MRKSNAKRVPWSETPAGREHEEFARRAALGRPKVDEGLCFVCQENLPTHEATRGEEKFPVCDECKAALISELATRNRIKQGLSRGRGGDIFRMVLGANLLPTRLEFKRLEERKEAK